MDSSTEKIQSIMEKKYSFDLTNKLALSKTWLNLMPQTQDQLHVFANVLNTQS
jgi:hypothetical protein